MEGCLLCLLKSLLVVGGDLLGGGSSVEVKFGNVLVLVMLVV